MSIEESSAREKVLVVCMLDSVHSARWLSMFSDKNIDFVLFPSTPNRAIHPQIKELLKNSPKQSSTYSITIFAANFSILIWGLGIITNLFVPAIILRKLAQKNNVKQIHAIELNHSGYIVNKAHKLGLPQGIKVITTNWGSDIYWFQQFSKHRKKLSELMQISALYTAECTRDLKLATDLGFTGKFGEVLPNAGGFKLSEIKFDSTKPSERKSIVIKGYESFVGRASLALAAVALNAHLLSEYKIHVYSANFKTIRIAKKIQKKYKLDIAVYPKKSLSHDRVLELFRQSRIYVGISLSDAISTSLLEAMVSGTYPIQTNTSCANEWIENGVTGSIVNPEVQDISSQLIKALTDNGLVDSAAAANFNTALSRLDSEVIKFKLQNFYQKNSN